MRKVHCTGCCTSCGRHFTSERAFDLHRSGAFEVTDPDGTVLSPNTRHCVAPVEVPALEARTESGVCTTGKQLGITVWGTRMANSERERLRKLRENPSQGSIPAAA